MTWRSRGATRKSCWRKTISNCVDLGSSNGTFVNEQRIDQHVLQSGDRVQVGRTLMIFTGNEDRSSVDLAAEVAIIDRGPASDGSRIVSSISREQGSHIFADADLSASPWLARARSNLQIMYRTALAVSHTLDIDQLLQRIMELIFEWVEADRGCIMLVDWESGEAIPKVFRSRRETAAASGCGSARRFWTTFWNIAKAC